MLIGPDKIDGAYVPIDTYFYNNEEVMALIQVKTSNQYSALCDKTNEPVAANEVGKVRTGGTVCGQLIMPQFAFDPTAVTIKWRVRPYPDWQAERAADGTVVNPEQATAILGYNNENNMATVALPPYQKICSLSIHFMACNQIYVDTGCQEKRTYDSLLEDLMRFKSSQNLCMARPTVTSSQEHSTQKTAVDAAKAERQSIAQKLMPYRKK